MRSIKEIECRVSVNRMVIGKWYRVITKSNNEYIFKYNGIKVNRSGEDCIGREYSYCVNCCTYESPTCVSVCSVESVRELYTTPNMEVLKYYDESKL
jgi:hypothetical protein